MLKIDHTENEVSDTYTFMSRGTWYGINIKKDKSDNFNLVSVFSNNYSVGVRGATLKCYNSLAELAKRSKALNNFTKLIGA